MANHALRSYLYNFMLCSCSILSPATACCREKLIILFPSLQERMYFLNCFTDFLRDLKQKNAITSYAQSAVA